MHLPSLLRLELRQICYFVLLAEADNNFSEAAKRLGIQQPPFSQRIQALERSLSTHTAEVRLLNRSRQPIELTAAGQAFLEEVQLALVHLDRAVCQAQRASQGQLGRLTIGIHNSVANTVFPEVLKRFQQRFPDVELELREVTVPEEISLLKTHQLDVVFHRTETPYEGDADLSWRPVAQESFLLVLPGHHPLAPMPQIPLRALKDEALILPSLDILPFYKQVITLCQAAGFEPKVVNTIRATGIVTLLSLAAAGVGIAVLPSHVQVLGRQGVVYRAIEGASLVRHITAVWRQKDSSIVLEKFLSILQEVMDSPSPRPI
ncbi:LysR family transcriptional regulator [Nodosilinea nodulosa]|uniref:LysR family transcriptional regulator n=1 Tax=Nodosilinea nodulosa TaxID=416001 RepID=UPI000308E52E|nr:LysR family transcriptional regulator [Nodosilinea nodulosa]